MSNPVLDFVNESRFVVPEEEVKEAGGMALWSGLTDEQVIGIKFEQGREHSIGGVISRDRAMRKAQADKSDGYIMPADTDERLGIKEKITKAEYKLRKDRYDKVAMRDALLQQHADRSDPGFRMQAGMFISQIAGSATSAEDIAVNFIPYGTLVGKALTAAKFTTTAARLANMGKVGQALFNGAIAAGENVAIGKYDQYASRKYNEEYSDQEILGDAAASFLLGATLPLIPSVLSKGVEVTKEKFATRKTIAEAADSLPEGEFKDSVIATDKDIAEYEMLDSTIAGSDIQKLSTITEENIAKGTPLELAKTADISFLEGKNPFEELDRTLNLDNSYRISTLKKRLLGDVLNGDVKDNMLIINPVEEGRLDVTINFESGMLKDIGFADIAEENLPFAKQAISDIYKAALNEDDLDGIIKQYENDIDSPTSDISAATVEHIRSIEGQKSEANNKVESFISDSLGPKSVTKAKIQAIVNSPAASSKRRSIESLETNYSFMESITNKEIQRQRPFPKTKDFSSVKKEVLESTNLDETIKQLIEDTGLDPKLRKDFIAVINKNIDEGKDPAAAIIEQLEKIQATAVSAGDPLKVALEPYGVRITQLEKALSPEAFGAISDSIDSAGVAMRVLLKELETAISDRGILIKGSPEYNEKQTRIDDLVKLINTDHRTIGKTQFPSIGGVSKKITEDTPGIEGIIFRLKKQMAEELGMSDSSIGRVFKGFRALIEKKGTLDTPSTGALLEAFNNLDKIKDILTTKTDTTVNVGAELDKLKGKLTTTDDAKFFVDLIVDHYEDLQQELHLLHQDRLNLRNNFYNIIRSKGGFAGNPKEALESILVNSNFGVEGSRANFENLKNAIESEIQAKLQVDLMEADLLPLFMNPGKANSRKIREALLYIEDPTGLNKPSDDYIKLATILNNNIQKTNIRLNSVGANLKGQGSMFRLNPEKLTDYAYLKKVGLPDTIGTKTKLFGEELVGGYSGREKRYKIGREHIYLEIINKLDHNKTFYARGIYSPDSQKRYIYNLLDNYVKGTSFRSKDGPNLMLKDADERLFFKHKEDYLEFLDEYGYDSAVDQLMTDSRKAARTYAALKTLSKNPEEHFNTLLEAVAQYTGADLAKSKRRMGHVISMIDGTSDVPENMAVASLFGGIRAFEMRKLWTTTVKSLSDVANNFNVYTNALSTVDYKGSALRREIYGITLKPSSMEEGARMAAKVNLATNIFSSSIMETYAVGKSIAKWNRGTQDFFMKYNLLRWFANGQQRAATAIASIEFHEQLSGMQTATNKNYIQLQDATDHASQVAKRYGIRIDRNEHKIIQDIGRVSKQEMESFMGREIEHMTEDMAFLSPTVIRNMPAWEFAEVLKKYQNHIPPDKQKKFDFRTDLEGRLLAPEAVNLYKDDLANKLSSLLMDIADEAITKPKAKAMSYVKHPIGRLTPGTFTGELVQTAMLFKSFPVARMMQDFGRIVNKGRSPGKHVTFKDWVLSPEFRDTASGPLPELAKFTASVMLLEYIGLAAAGYLHGQTPEKHDANLVSHLIQRTSILGPGGDLVINFFGPSDYDRTRGAASIGLGPALGSYTTNVATLGGDIYAEKDFFQLQLQRAAKGIIQDPGWKIPLLSIPLRMAILDPMLEWVEPGSLVKRWMKDQEKEIHRLGE
jgi:hypothetical protein